MTDEEFDREGLLAELETLRERVKTLTASEEELKSDKGALRMAEETYRGLFQNTQVGLSRTRLSDGKFLELNDYIVKMFGYESPEEFMAEYSAVKCYADPVERDRLFSILKEKGKVDDFVTRARRKDGSIFWIRFSARIDSEGGYIDAVSVDITREKEAEEEKKFLQAELIQSQKMEAVGRLAGGIAHDFNNILMAVRSFSYLGITRLSEKDPSRELFMDIRNASDSAVDLTRQLLIFSRKKPVILDTLELNETIGSILTLLERLIGETVLIKTSFDPELKAISADRGSMEQVITNLVLNARDSMPTGGMVKVETESITLKKDLDTGFSCSTKKAWPGGLKKAPEGGYVRLSVKDVGRGIATEDLEHIFEPFFTTKAGLTDAGTGLGLSVVYGIVKRHGGYIDVTSMEGCGTTFDVYLPSVEPEAGSGGVKKDEVEEVEPRRGRGERIFVIEDDALVRMATKMLLREGGYETIEASSVKRAVEIFSEAPEAVSLVLSDYMLPDGNGLELIEELRGVSPSVGAILCSAYIGREVDRKEIEERGIRLLSKPYEASELFKEIQKVIRGTATSLNGANS